MAPAPATGTSVEGQSRAYRSDCLTDVSPLEERLGWDGLDEMKANSLGWRTRSLRDLPFRHHRSVAARDASRLRAWIAQGEANHYMGYRPSYAVMRALVNACREPSALALVVGYASAALRRAPRCPDPGVRVMSVDSRHGASSPCAPANRSGDDETRRPSARLRGRRPCPRDGGASPAWESFTRTWVTRDPRTPTELFTNEHVVRGAGPLHAACVPLLKPTVRTPPGRVTTLVTVGTCEFPFDRLIRALDGLPDDEAIVVQAGESTLGRRRGRPPSISCPAACSRDICRKPEP